MMQEEPENMRNINDKFQVWKKRDDHYTCTCLNPLENLYKQFEKDTLETQHVETSCNLVAEF